MHILISEDEKTMAQMLKRAVDEKGHESDLAFTGRDYLERARRNEYDVIVLDLRLPDTDGFQVTKTLRSETERTRDVLATQVALAWASPSPMQSHRIMRPISP